MSSLDSPFVAGQVVDGRYRLERPLGEGGMGLVWIGYQLALDREVAIKSIRPERADDHSRLEREARLLATVHHPAVVQIHDFGFTTAGTGYVVMELVRGPTLEAHLAQLGPRPCEEAVALMLPVLDGLAAVHAAGIVHRDIKPANIVLSKEGPPGAPHWMPKLVDFGIARNGVTSSFTVAGAIIGTPAYMAPEQFRGASVEQAADLWAVGVTLYESIAGEPPFGGGSMYDILRRVNDEPTPYPRRAVGLDGALWRILTDALQKEPTARPAGALELRRRLSEWLAGRSADPRARAPARHDAPSAAAPLSSAAALTETAPRSATFPRPRSEPPPLARHETLDALIRARLRQT